VLGGGGCRHGVRGGWFLSRLTDEAPISTLTAPVVPWGCLPPVGAGGGANVAHFFHQIGGHAPPGSGSASKRGLQLGHAPCAHQCGAAAKRQVTNPTVGACVGWGGFDAPPPRHARSPIPGARQQARASSSSVKVWRRPAVRPVCAGEVECMRHGSGSLLRLVREGARIEGGERPCPGRPRRRVRCRCRPGAGQCPAPGTGRPACC
jgi:hypothetical protein